VVSTEILHRPVGEAAFLGEITVLILAYNEASNIGRTLERLRWASRIVIVDSFSTDETLAIASRFPNVEIIQRRFDSFARQCNFGLEHIHSPWVLSLDADYVLSDELVTEIASLKPDTSKSGYQVRFHYCIRGTRLRASLYPPRTILYRKRGARYIDDGHGHRVVVNGERKMLSGWVDHDDRKSLDRWLCEQRRYAIAETQKLLESPANELNFADRVRQWIVPAPFLVFFYTLFVNGLILDGWPGWYYVFQRTLAEILLSLRLIETRFNTKPRS